MLLIIGWPGRWGSDTSRSVISFRLRAFLTCCFRCGSPIDAYLHREWGVDLFSAFFSSPKQALRIQIFQAVVPCWTRHGFRGQRSTGRFATSDDGPKSFSLDRIEDA